MSSARDNLHYLAMWDEWAASPFRGADGAAREIRGILDGLPVGKGSSEEILFSSRRLWIFRRLSTLWNGALLSEVALFPQLLSIPKKMKGRVFLRLPPHVLPVLRQRGRPGVEWLKGVWGSCGALYIPRTGYYMSFRAPSHRVGCQVAGVLRREGVFFGERRSHNRTEITVRNQEDIVTVLSRFSMNTSSLMLEERAIVRSMKDRANRLVNCDASNIRKALEASSRQMEIACSVAPHMEDPAFPDVLRHLVETRMENPSLSLEELGRIQMPPVSKSTVQYRWKKLEKIAMDFPVRHHGTPQRRRTDDR